MLFPIPAIAAQHGARPTIKSLKAIYVAGRDGRIFSFSPGGALNWVLTAHTSTINNLTLKDGYLYMAAHGLEAPEAIARITTEGTIDWSSSASSDRVYGIRAHDDAVYTAGEDDVLRKMSLTTGAVINSVWGVAIDNRGLLLDSTGIYTSNNDPSSSIAKFDFDLNLLWQIPNTPGAYIFNTDDKYFDSSGNLYFGTRTGKVLKINPQDGAIYWETQLDPNDYPTEAQIDRNGRIFTKTLPLTDGSTKIREIDSTTGAFVKEFTVPDRVWSISSDNNGNVFIGDLGYKIRKINFNTPTPTEMWSFATEGWIPHVAYADFGAGGSDLYAGGGETYFYRLSQTDGTILWSYPIGSRARVIVFEPN